MSPLHPGVIEAVKALSDAYDCMVEQKEWLDSQADELRSRWAHQYLANRASGPTVAFVASPSSRKRLDQRLQSTFVENRNEEL